MNRPVVIVVDDDKHLVELLQSYLEGLGCIVYTGFDGQAAWSLAKIRKPALAIMDVDMPFVSGLRALELMRKDDLTKNIPVILLTGMASGSVYPQIASAPNVSHIKKPVELEDLGSIVRHYLPGLAV